MPCVRLFTRKRQDGSLELDWLPMTEDLYESLLQLRQTAMNEWAFPIPKTGMHLQTGTNGFRGSVKQLV